MVTWRRFIDISLVLCCASAVTLIARRELGTPRPDSAPAFFTVGHDLPAMSDIDWSAANRNLLLMVSARCKACAEAAPFLRRLVERAGRRQGTRIYLACAEGAATGSNLVVRYGLDPSLVTVATVRFVGDRTIYFPAILLLDATGVVLSGSVGKPDARRESKLLEDFAPAAYSFSSEN